MKAPGETPHELQEPPILTTQQHKRQRRCWEPPRSGLHRDLAAGSSSAKTSSLSRCRISLGNCSTAALGEGTALGGIGTNLGFPSGDGRSAFRVAISQVPEGLGHELQIQMESFYQPDKRLPKTLIKYIFRRFR